MNNIVNNEYLEKMNDVVFLSKEEQISLGKKIKKIEKELLSKCCSYKAFKDQILTLKGYLQSNSNNIFKYSNLIDNNSTSKEIKKVEKYFQDLFKLIESDSCDEKILKILVKIKLTSSTFHQLIDPLKKQYSHEVNDREFLEKILTTLELKSSEELIELKEKLQENSFRIQYVRHIGIPESRLLNYINSGLDLIGAIKLSNLELFKLGDLCEIIETLEQEMSKYRNMLIESSLPLVIHRAKKFVNKGLDIEDLIQEGNIGLIKAVDKFEPSKNVKLTSYAQWWIDQAIRRAISNKSKTIRIPIHIQNMLQTIHKTYNHLVTTTGKQPSFQEISKASGIPLKTVSELTEAFHTEFSLDQENLDGSFNFESILDSGTESPFEATNKKLIKDKIREVLKLLPPRSEKIIRLRFGIGEPNLALQYDLSKRIQMEYSKIKNLEENEHTLESVGELEGVTRERIRQLEGKAIKKLLKHEEILQFKPKGKK